MQYFVISIHFLLINIKYFFLFYLSNINIYEATVPDRMHHLDLGLFHYQINYTQELLKIQHGNYLVDEVNHRLSVIPRYPGLKIFSNGLQSIARLTANEYRNLMKVMVFVVDNLYEENTKNVKNYINNKKLVEIYEKWNEMYEISRNEIFKDSDLIKFEVCI
jgi:hypothetical protein